MVLPWILMSRAPTVGFMLAAESNPSRPQTANATVDWFSICSLSSDRGDDDDDDDAAVLLLLFAVPSAKSTN